jgi:RNA polymerase sigma-70 factor (ECF subfamily)
MTALSAMLAADVELHSDGGGKRMAAIVPILGHAAVMKVHTYLSQKIWPQGSELLRVGLVNGLPGFVTREVDGELQTTALDIVDGAIIAIYVMRNPEKLKHLH